MSDPIPASIAEEFKSICADFRTKQADYEKVAKRLSEDLGEHADFRPLIHSTKYRSKDPEHLEGKLNRKYEELADKSKFDITVSNYETRIEDLAGCRVLHIHTKQIEQIHPKMVEILEYYSYKLVKKPISYTWDIENTALFKSLGIAVKSKPSLYTSTHYIVKAPSFPGKCEIQVRTLAEELWGEVSHTINYPHETESIACSEQLFALARFTSGCTRLVDSLFASQSEHDGIGHG